MTSKRVKTGADIVVPNQKVKETIGKAKLHLNPTQINYDIAAVREYGNNKYPEGGPENWRTVDPVDFLDAAYRHLLAEIAEPGSRDKESGLTHLAHLSCNVAFLCEFAEEKRNGKV